MRIAVDAMGGGAPSLALEGAYQAAQLFPDLNIILVGDDLLLKESLNKQGIILPVSVSIVHASEVVEMSESPVVALRKKKKSSVAVAADLVKQGYADALVTAGNTGAAVVATTLKWRMLKGISRPAIALPIPNKKDVSVILDVGANVDCKPIHYLHYGIMGKIYAENIFHKTNARVGLLNVGEEDSKGGADIKEVFKILKDAPFNFIGNVEGRDIFNGHCDVIVCNGFLGNVVLKVSEGVTSLVKDMAKTEFKRNLISLLGAFLSRGVFNRLKKKIDYSAYGGAPLLGVDGICIISHGSSNAEAFCNAIRVARECAIDNVNVQIVKELEDNDSF